jgi:outer membrane cobalamin receptor
MRPSMIRLMSATILLGSGSVPAEDQSPPAEIVVTATRLEEALPQQLAQYGVRVDTLSRQAVQNGSYIDVAQSLQALAPGLYLQPKNGPFDYADISLLGSRTEDVLWLVDGVRINNRLYSSTPPLDTLPAGMIDRIEVLEGGQALFYGTAAVAGAVNIVTKAFSDTPQGALSVAADSNKSRHLDAEFSDAIGAHHFVVYGSTDESDGYRAFRQADYQPSSTHRDRGYDVRTLGAKYAYDFSTGLRLSASYQHTDADVDFALPYRVARDVNSRQEGLATMKLDYEPGERVGFYLKSYYHWWHTHYDTVYNDLAVPGHLDVLYQHAFWGYDDRGINALARFSLTPGIDYFLGYDLQRYGGRDEVLYIAPNHETTQAVFGQIRTTSDFIANAHFAAGFRYNSPDVGLSATVWSLSGQYDFSHHLFFRAALGTNFRLPSAEELFANDPLDERGNPNLRPERSQSLNVSLGGIMADRFHWELIGFARDIRDLIDFDQFDPVTQQSVFNNVPGTVRVRGWEAVLDGSISAALGINSSYTQNCSLQDNDAQISRIPEQLAKLSVDYHPPGRRVGATLTLNHTGKVFTTVGANRVGYGDTVVVDLSGRFFFDHDHKHRITLSVQNLFDKEYGRPQQGCADVATDGPFDCSAPYTYVNLGLPRTLRASYTHEF